LGMPRAQPGTCDAPRWPEPADLMSYLHHAAAVHDEVKYPIMLRRMSDMRYECCSRLPHTHRIHFAFHVASIRIHANVRRPMAFHVESTRKPQRDP
jgi:hypothetical protein